MSRRSGVTSGRARLGVDALGTPVLVALVLATLPVVRMAVWVLGGTPVQYSDYWLIIDGLLKNSGWFSPRDLVALYNGHLMVLPKVAYWLNIRAFGGSNTTLGLFVVAMGAAMAALLLRIVPRGRSVHPLVTGAVVVATTAFLFAPHGVWSYMRSMSGTAWIMANLFAVAALVTAHVTDRRVPAVGLAALSALSYGTGVVALPALLLVFVLRDRRLDWRRQWAPVAVGAGFALWYRLDDGVAEQVARPGPWRTVVNAVTVLGLPVAPDSPTAARWAGAALLAGGAALAAWAVHRHVARAHPWVGLLAFAVGCSLLIGYGRAVFTDFLDSRYVCVGVLAWISVLALLALAVGRHALVALPIGAAALLVASSGLDTVRSTRDSFRLQQELADAQRLGIADGSQLWIGLRIPMPPLSERLRTVGHHPFDGGGEPGCGLLGTTVDPGRLRPVGEGGTAGSAIARRPGSFPRGLLIGGYVDPGDAEVACVVVIDAHGEVVGLGTWGWDRQRLDGTEAEDGVRAVAPRDVQGPRLAVRLEGSEDLYVVEPSGG